MKVLTDPRHYAAIAAAIRNKSGSSDLLRPDEMAAAIEAIQTGGDSYLDYPEYIRSTGSQYLNTGFIPNSKTKIEIRYLEEQTSVQYVALFAARGRSFTSELAYFPKCANINTSKYFGYGGGNYFDTQNPFYRVETTVTIDANVLTLKSGDVEESYTAPAATFTCSAPIILCGEIGNTNSLASPYSGRIYSCKIWDDGTLVRDFVPVSVFGEVGMLDRAEGKLYKSSGSSAFIAGPIR